MRNSLKLMVGVVLATLLMNGQAKAERHQKPNAYVPLPSDTHVYQYIPSDLRSNVAPNYGTPYRCDKEGHAILSKKSTSYGNCLTYHSESNNSRWVISYIPYITIDNDGLVKAKTFQVLRIFKVLEGKNKLWVAFEETKNSRTATYVSTGAQKFASTKGNSDIDFVQSDESTGNDIAQAPQPTKENCAGKNFFEKAACELKNAGVENAVGTVINNSR